MWWRFPKCDIEHISQPLLYAGVHSTQAHWGDYIKSAKFKELRCHIDCTTRWEVDYTLTTLTWSMCASQPGGMVLGSESAIWWQQYHPWTLLHYPTMGTHTHAQRESWHCCLDRCSWLLLASVPTALYDTLPQWGASYGVPVNMG